MQTIRQEHPTGCALACLAMLSGQSYQAIYARFGGRIRQEYGDNLLSISELTMRQFCAELGITMDPDIDFEDWSVLTHGTDIALVAINPKTRGSEPPDWHWVVYDGKAGFVRDPHHTIQRTERTDYGRMRPYFYARVELPQASALGNRKTG